jgi:hypothetical protein
MNISGYAKTSLIDPNAVKPAIITKAPEPFPPGLSFMVNILWHYARINLIYLIFTLFVLLHFEVPPFPMYLTWK